ncbi:MAG: hypothetical protein HWN81_00090 [Candidatus Lokiarchaeota archaeon]|nr:hypothetical protein [Candidatus Lokiarchaeota archaeon]
MSDLPVNKDENFVGEFETMDLNELRDKQFMVAVATGDPEKCKYLCGTLHGPYEFTEMLDEVGSMYLEHQHHAKILICGTDKSKRLNFLDRNTIDYIEANYEDLIMNEVIEGIVLNDEYTCKAGINEVTDDEDFRFVEKEGKNDDN